MNLKEEKSEVIFVNDLIKQNSALTEFVEIKQESKEVQATTIHRDKESQAVPTTRSITSNTGWKLMKAYLGEKGDLIIKNTELNLTADKQL